MNVKDGLVPDREPPSDVPAAPAGGLSQVLLETLRDGLTEAFSVLLTRFEQARHQHDLGYGDIALIALEQLARTLERRAPEGAEPVQRRLLRASTYALLGRIYRESNEPSRAREILKAATELFAQMSSFLEEQAGSYRADYGMALLLLGETEHALEVLDKVISEGSAPPEIVRELGLRLQSRGDHARAEPLLQKAVEHAPDQIKLWTALAESLDVLQRRGEAAEAYRKAAYLQIESDRLADACELLKRSLAGSPNDVTSLWTLGEIERTVGHADEAVAAFNRALSIDEKHIPSLVGKAAVLRAFGTQVQLSAARALLDQAQVLAPGHARVWMEKGLLSVQLKDYAAAIMALEHAQDLDPDDLEVLFQLGEAYRLSHREADARAAIGRVLSAQPEHARALGTQGQLLMAQGNFREAIKPLQRAVDLAPTMGWAWEELGDALWRSDRNEEALQAFERALEITPENPTALAGNVLVLLDLDRPEHAIELLVPVIDRYPWAKSLRAEALCLAERWDEALEAYEQAREQNPQDSWLLGKLAQFYCDIGEFSLAVEVARQATVEESEPWLFGIMGWALENLGAGRAAEAESAYRESLRTNDPNPWNRKGLANALLLQGRREEARMEYLMVLEAVDQDASQYRHELLGWCHYGLQQYEDAIRHYIAALSSERMMIGTQFDLALALLCSGRYGLAMEEYQKGLAMARQKHSLRQRGLLHVAIADLSEATSAPEIPKANLEVPEVGHILDALQAAVDVISAPAMVAV